METCITCSIVEAVENAGLDAAQTYFTATNTIVIAAVNGFLGLVILFIIAKAMIKGEFDKWDFAEKLIWGVLVIGILNYPETYYDNIYNPARQLVWALFEYIVTDRSGPVSGSASAFLWSVEQGFAQVIRSGMFLIEGAGRFDFLVIIGALAMIIPFFMSMKIMAVYVVYVFGLLLLPLALAPMMIGAMIFKTTRGIAFAGFEIFIASVSYLLIAAIFSNMAILLATARVDVLLQLEENRTESYWTGAETLSSEAAKDFIFSNDYLSVLMIGWICVMLMLSVPKMGQFFLGRLRWG